MPNIQDFKARLKQIGEEIKTKLPDIAIILVVTAKALAERHIKDKGFEYVYSENKIPAWFLRGKELNQKGTNFLENHGVNVDGTTGEGKKKRRKKKGDPDPGSFETVTNWKEFRAAQGLQTQFVDLSYSNKMFANMGPVKTEESNGGIVVAFLGATNREAQDKMNFNFARYGDFIGKALTEEDRRLITEAGIAEITQILDQLKF